MQTGILDEPLRCKLGQTFDETFYFTDEAGSPVDVSGYAFSLMLRENKNADVAATADCSFVSPNGCRIVIAASITASLKIRAYKTDLKMVNGSVVDFGFEGDFIIEEAITRS
jgi:hypothetical protein